MAVLCNPLKHVSSYSNKNAILVSNRDLHFRERESTPYASCSMPRFLKVTWIWHLGGEVNNGALDVAGGQHCALVGDDEVAADKAAEATSTLPHQQQFSITILPHHHETPRLYDDMAFTK